MYSLHPTLANDCFLLGNFPLSQLLLMNDSQYPWFILVPQRDKIREVYELSDEDQRQLNKESSFLSKILASEYTADKMNVAALGNVVAQLHIHHIVRYKTDPSWPSPIWGKLAAVPYQNVEETRNRILSLVGTTLEFAAID